MVDTDFNTLYDDEKIRQNANIPGPLVHPLAHIALRSAEMHDVGVKLGIEDPEDLQTNVHDKYLSHFLQLTRSVQMKGSEQYVRIAQGMMSPPPMHGAGQAPNLAAAQAAPVGQAVVLPIFANGAKDIAKRGLRRFGFGR